MTNKELKMMVKMFLIGSEKFICPWDSWSDQSNSRNLAEMNKKQLKNLKFGTN